MGERFRNKLQQLDRLKELLLAHPEGLRKAEIARRLGVHRATISDYLDDLGYVVPVYEPHDDHFAIQRDFYQVEVLLTLHEAMALHLASRLLATRTDKHNAHAAKALRALGTALEKIAPMVCHHLRLSAELLDSNERRQDPIFMQALETLTLAWARGCKVELTHEMDNGRVYTYTFAPYFIEPYAIGRTMHVIGFREPPGKMRTFKIERIRTIRLLPEETYAIPDSFDPREMLKDAWGIWYTEEPPVEVVLLFSRQVAQRVGETQWHHTQSIAEQPDGSIEWRAQVAEWREMLPWIRSWGSAVEVLEPTALRQVMIREVLNLAKVYELNSDTKDNSIMDIFEQYTVLPGKTDPQLTIFEHSSDVFHIALYLLEANGTAVQYPDLVKAGALLHDVGKIEQDLRQEQWVHQPHSKKYLQQLLDHPRLQSLMSENDIDMNKVDFEDLLLICEHHHDIPTRPELLRRNPDVLLVSVADIIASSIEGGWLGEIREMLAASPYIRLNTTLLTNLGLAGGLDQEIHRIDLPATTVPDALLADLIYRNMGQHLETSGMIPLLQKNGSLWIIADDDSLRKFLEKYTVDPRALYKTADIDDSVFENLLTSPSFPAPGSLEPSSLKFLLINEQIARRMAASLALRKSTKKALEYFDIPISEIGEIFSASQLAEDLLQE